MGLEFAENKLAVDFNFEGTCLEQVSLNHVGNDESDYTVEELAFLDLLYKVRCLNSDCLTNCLAHHDDGEKHQL